MKQSATPKSEPAPVRQADHDCGWQRETRGGSDQADGGKQGVCG
ncbi:hypothetical protein [Falsirhodobacter xinxiangensis]|nr:hypothetical protein [Rhodobacter xinxiangensis]